MLSTFKLIAFSAVQNKQCLDTQNLMQTRPFLVLQRMLKKGFRCDSQNKSKVFRDASIHHCLISCLQTEDKKKKVYSCFKLPVG